MGLDIPACEWKSLSYKERRKLINKEKKRIKRLELAKQRCIEAEGLVEYEKYLKSAEGIEEQKLADQKRHQEEIERRLKHEEWLEREHKIQEEFQRKREKEEIKLKEREEREKMIKEEWEELERREKQAAEKRKKGRTSKEAMLEEALAGIDETLVSMGNDERMPWHNPFAPAEDDRQSKRPTKTTATSSSDSRFPVAPPISLQDPDPVKNYGTEKDKINCPFFIKTGACRYGDTCSRTHPVPSASSTLIIRNMYNHSVLTQQFPDDQDAGLEVDDSELMEDYTEFYNDVYPALAKCGKVVQFKVSRNYEPHLKGNVYVQFSTEEECAAAVKVFNGRWYAGKKLSCAHCPVQRWRTAICGLYNRQQCPKGKHCNFLHVFENPGGAFSLGVADGEDNSPPDRRRGSHHNRRGYTRDDYRRRPSLSPDGSPPPSSHRRGRNTEGRRRYSSPRRRSRSPSDRRREQSPRRRDSRSHYYSRKRRRSHSNERKSYSRSVSPDRRQRGRYSSHSSEDDRRDKSASRERDERKHKKKKKKSKAKHSKKHKDKQSRDHHHSSSDSESLPQGKDMEEMMDEVLRHIT